jgi:hypothetical protein
MKALTLTQPWATLIAVGAKTIETRSWGTGYRGPLAIHAAKGFGELKDRAGLQAICARPAFYQALIGAVEAGLLTVPAVDSLPRGAIVAVAELVSVWKAHLIPDVLTLEWGTRDGTWRMTPQERAFGDYRAGRWAWLLANVRRLPEPVSCKGALSLWELPADVLAAVNAQLQEAS